MKDQKDSIEITPEMKAQNQKIHDAIGAPELTIAGYAKGAFAALAGSSDPLGITSAFVADLQARIAELKEQLAHAIADGKHAVACVEIAVNERTELAEATSLIGRQLTQADADVRLWKGNYEAAEQHVTILRQQLSENDARWQATFDKRCAREHELIEETVDGFCDALMAKLNEHGVDTTGWNSDDPEETALAHNLCAIADDLTEARAQTTVWAADALNCKQAIRALMRFMPETLADTVQESERGNFLRAVTYAKRCLSSGGGGLGLGENASPKEATDNVEVSDRAGDGARS